MSSYPEKNCACDDATTQNLRTDLMPQVIAAVGSGAATSSQSSRSITVNPASVGNLVVLFVIVEAQNASLSVSGGNCDNWTQIVTWAEHADSNLDTTAIWMGAATATGSASATVTTNAPNNTWVDLARQEFTCEGVSPNTVWTIDNAAHQENASSTTVTYPTLTPSGDNRMYIGYGLLAGDNSGGQTDGYTLQLDDVANPYIFNPSVAGPQNPISKTSGNGKSSTGGALLYADNPVNTTGFFPFFGL